MGFFNRRPAAADRNTSNAVDMENLNSNGGTVREKPNRLSRGRNKQTSHNRYDRHNEGTLNTRPSFGQWAKVTWPDILTMIIMGIIGLGVYEAPPAPSRSFPVYFPDGDIVYPEFAYPLRKEIVPIWAAALLAALVPIFFFLVMQIRIRSFWDVNNAVIGLLYSLISAAVFQVFLKWLIGGLRPHFLAVCKPAVPAFGAQTGNGFGGIMYDRKVCTGDTKQINDSLESFPSGHSTAAFAGFIFLYLYLNAKLKVWSNYHPAYWKLIVTYMPVLAAVLIAGALTIDEFHNYYDVIAGAIIGTVMAFSAYRMVYASVWDFRFNHIPLTRHLPFTYGDGPFDGFHDALWTRQAGWGTHEGGAWGGAPFDASHAARGSGGIAAEGAGITNGHGRQRSGSGVGRHSADGYQGRSSISRKPVGARGEQMRKVYRQLRDLPSLTSAAAACLGRSEEENVGIGMVQDTAITDANTLETAYRPYPSPPPEQDPLQQRKQRIGQQILQSVGFASSEEAEALGKKPRRSHQRRESRVDAVRRRLRAGGGARAQRYRSLDGLNAERDAVQWWWRLVSIGSSLMILGGFLILPATFDTDPLLRVSKAVLGIFSVALLTAGFSFTGLLCFAVRNPLFQADSIFLPALTSCALGLLTIFYDFLISSRYVWNTPALLLTIAASLSTITYGVLLIYTQRKISSIKSRGAHAPLNLQGARPASLNSDAASAMNYNYQAPGYYENYIANMFPASTRQMPQGSPGGYDPNNITEEEMQRQQMLMLLLHREQPPTPDPSQSTFHLDWQPGEQEDGAPAHGFYAPNGQLNTPGSAYPPSGHPGSAWPQSGYPNTAYPQTAWPQSGHPQSAGYPPPQPGLLRRLTEELPPWDGQWRGGGPRSRNVSAVSGMNGQWQQPSVQDRIQDRRDREERRREIELGR